MLYYLFVFSPAKKRIIIIRSSYVFLLGLKEIMHVKSLSKVAGIRKHLWKHIRENNSYQGYCYYFSYLLNLAYSQLIIKSQFTKRCLKLKKVIWTIQIFQFGYEIQWNWSTGKRKSTAYFNLLAETWPNLVKMQSNRQTKKNVHL